MKSLFYLGTKQKTYYQFKKTDSEDKKMYEKVCSINKETCVGNKDGKCISMENCMHKSEIHKCYNLNLDKINTIDDCKKILKFLCQTTIKPLRSDLEYTNFSEVRDYFTIQIRQQSD